jgi:hypothetical protein
MLERKIDTRPRDSLGRLLPTHNAKKAINFKLRPDVFAWLREKLSYTTYVESLVIQAKTEEEMDSSVKVYLIAEKLIEALKEVKPKESSKEWELLQALINFKKLN